MSDVIMVQFDKGDEDVAAAIREAFATQVEFIEVKNFDGGVAEYVQALLPVVPAVAQVLMSYFTRPGHPRRVIVTSEGDMSIEGLSREDVERLIDKAREDPRA
jgi:hypothetical protein